MNSTGPCADPFGPPPAVPDAVHPIDAFVLSELRQRGLRPSPPADPLQLRRRVSSDLIGLPPTEEDLDRIAEEPYEDYVDRLPSSPHFGEADGRGLARRGPVRGYGWILRRQAPGDVALAGLG